MSPASLRGPLRGVVVLVTGGGSGLGAASARLLYARGASVALLDMSLDKVEEVAAEFSSDRALALAADVTLAAEVEGVLDRIEAKFGGLHSVMNCAGVGVVFPTITGGGPHDLDLFKFCVGVNLTGLFNVCRLAAMRIVRTKSHASRKVIINVASAAGQEGQKGQVAYAASKGGVIAMTLPMARDLGRYGVRVMCIAPGIIDTPLMASASAQVKDGLLNSVVAPRRFGEAGEFAALAVHCIDNGYLNGETIRIDGAIRFPSGCKPWKQSSKL